MEALKDEFRSERLLYRGAQTDDSLWIHNVLRNNSVIQSLSSPALLRPTTKAKDEDICQRYQNAMLGVIICLIPEGTDEAPQRIGTMMLNVPPHASVANHNRRCELGISLAPEFQNKGYGTEAITWAIDWAFRFANMHCVCLNTISFNVRGRKVYEKIGFKLEGRLRHYKWYDREWHDQLLYSILEDEWEAIQRAKADA